MGQKLIKRTFDKNIQDQARMNLYLVIIALLGRFQRQDFYI